MAASIGGQSPRTRLLNNNDERRGSESCCKLRNVALAIIVASSVTSIITRGYFCDGGLNGEDEECYEKNPHLAPVELTGAVVLGAGILKETFDFIRDRCLQ